MMAVIDADVRCLASFLYEVTDLPVKRFVSPAKCEFYFNSTDVLTLELNALDYMVAYPTGSRFVRKVYGGQIEVREQKFVNCSVICSVMVVLDIVRALKTLCDEFRTSYVPQFVTAMNVAPTFREINASIVCNMLSLYLSKQVCFNKDKNQFKLSAHEYVSLEEYSLSYRMDAQNEYECTVMYVDGIAFDSVNFRVFANTRWQERTLDVFLGFLLKTVDESFAPMHVDTVPSGVIVSQLPALRRDLRTFTRRVVRPWLI